MDNNPIYLQPTEAMRAISGCAVLPSWNWNELIGNMHNQAFVVAKMTQIDLLEDTRRFIRTAIREGLSGEAFRLHMESRLRLKGWWGKQTRMDPKTGKISQVVLGTPYRIDNIFRTNVQSAYASGKWRRFYDNKESRPIIEYVAILDGVTRDLHRSLHGFTAEITDPVWDRIFPPNGYRCRCDTRALTEAQAAKRNKRKVMVPDGFPDPGFEGNPGKLGDVTSVALLYKKARAAGEMPKFRRFISSPQRTSFLTDIAIPSIGGTGAIYLLNKFTRLDGTDISLTIGKAVKPGLEASLVASATASGLKMYRNTKTQEIYIQKKGARFVYFVFSPAGKYKSTKVVLRLSRGFTEI